VQWWDVGGGGCEEESVRNWWGADRVSVGLRWLLQAHSHWRSLAFRSPEFTLCAFPKLTRVLGRGLTTNCTTCNEKCCVKHFAVAVCVPSFNLFSVSGFPGGQPQMFLERISAGSDAAAGISRLRRSRCFAGHRECLRVGSRARRLGQECSETPK